MESDCERTNVGFDQLAKIAPELLVDFREETLEWFQQYIDSIGDAVLKELSLYKLANFFFVYAVDKLGEYYANSDSVSLEFTRLTIDYLQ